MGHRARLSTGWGIGRGALLGILALMCLLVACQERGRSQSDVSQAPEIPTVALPPAAPTAQPVPVEVEALSDEALIAFGAELYATNCAPCHQPNGEGNLGQFPALNRNAFVTVSDPTAVIQTVLYGRQIMPAFAPVLNPQETAAVISYVRNAWNNQAPTVSIEQVQTVMEAQGAQRAALVE